MRSDSLKLYLFKVGAGDHIMMEFPDGSLGIIDSFYTDQDLLLQEPPALTYLKYLVEKEKKKEKPGKVVISFVTISHADLDHIKGIDLLFSFILSESAFLSLENLWLFGGMELGEYKTEIERMRSAISNRFTGAQRNEIDLRAKKYLNLLERIGAFKKKWSKLNDGKSEFYFRDFTPIQKYGGRNIFSAFSLGPIARILQHHNDGNTISLIKQLFEQIQDFSHSLDSALKIDYNTGIDRNCISAILGIHFYSYNLIFGGDVNRKVMEASLEDIPRRCEGIRVDLFNPDFLKANHHGAKGATSVALWEKLYPAPKGDVIIGISAGRRHAHPHAEFFEDVASCCKSKGIGQKIYRTNQCATCKEYPGVTAEVNLDEWFQYNGCAVEDIRIEEALANEKPEKNGDLTTSFQNVLALIFEFPANGTNKDILVYKGVSTYTGNYESCVFERKSRQYCV